MGGYNQSNGRSGQESGSASTMSGQSTTGLTPAQLLGAYNQYLPSTLTAMQNAQAAQLAPGGAGAKVATEASALQRQLNPEYYSALGSANRGASAGVDASNRLMGSINLNGLSPGEYAATERGLNQYNTGTGNAGLANPTNTISNAMNFGGAFNSKVGMLGNAIGANSSAANSASAAAGAASPNTSGFNAATTALGGGNTFGNSYLDSIMRTGQSSQSANSSSFGKGTSSNNAFGAEVSGSSLAACCFIFMEAYNGQMPGSVRRYRDRYYRLRPDIATGYKRMAKWLVPLMQQYPIVRKLVWKLMIKPATLHTVKPMNNWNKHISHFWLNFWAFYGKV